MHYDVLVVFRLPFKFSSCICWYYKYHLMFFCVFFYNFYFNSQLHQDLPVHYGSLNVYI